MEANLIKVIASAVAGMLAAFLAPLAPYALLCTVMVLADVVSAWQLGRRMRRKGVASAAGRLSSRRFGRVVGTLAKCYGALAVAALMQKYVVEGMVEGFDAVRGLTGLICSGSLCRYWRMNRPAQMRAGRRWRGVISPIRREAF